MSETLSNRLVKNKKPQARSLNMDLYNFNIEMNLTHSSQNQSEYSSFSSHWPRKANLSHRENINKSQTCKLRETV